MIQAKKSLGQNFLRDKNIILKIISALDIGPDDLIIEIGPGMGALTSQLIQFPNKIYAIDADIRAVEYLQSKFPKQEFGNLNLVHSDIRNIKINELCNAGDFDKIKVIGNIPYNISSDISFWLFEQSALIQNAVIMYQKEVASRFFAKKNTKEYGILTLAVELTGRCGKLFDVSPACFTPVPKVTSTVVKFEFPDVNFNYEYFKSLMSLIKTAFNQRRKTLRNSIKDYLESKTKMSIRDIESKFLQSNINLLSLRAEDLSAKDYISIFENIKLMRKSDE